MKKYLYRLLLALALLLISGNIYAQKHIDGVRIVGFVDNGTDCHIGDVYNNRDEYIEVIVDGGNPIRINAHSSASIKATATKRVKINLLSHSIAYWKKSVPDPPAEPEKSNSPIDQDRGKKKTPTPNDQMEEPDINKVVVCGKLDTERVLADFKDYLQQHSFFADEVQKAIDERVNMYCEVRNTMEPEKWADYAKEKNIPVWLKEIMAEWQKENGRYRQLVENFLVNKYGDVRYEDKEECLREMEGILKKGLERRKASIDKVNGLVSGIEKTTQEENGYPGWIVLGIGFLVLIAGFFFYRRFIIKKVGASAVADSNNAAPGGEDEGNIEVRQTKGVVMKPQDISDVVDNSAYLKICCADFCDDSAVRNIYFKNTCVKDIYNMYAEDLRNPNNPKEDGCLVVGRWIHDEATDTYDVSLEEIVQPGDDAVFKEYELNFGGKIKLKLADRLRRLRRATNLQYDMTCWVHSHPGLGVFFSNADSGVQMQLKNPAHPKFLTAIVVDILTPNQEMGIFCFRQDMTINSKNDLRKMYSLEDLYKWAVESERSEYRAEDYYTLLAPRTNVAGPAYGVALSNGGVIDLCRLVDERSKGLSAWVHGFTVENEGRPSVMVAAVSPSDSEADCEVEGCFIVGDTFDASMAQMEVARSGHDIKFVLYYLTYDDTLWAIPVVDGRVLTDASMYGHNTLNDLKIWTRRKR